MRGGHDPHRRRGVCEGQAEGVLYRSAQHLAAPTGLRARGRGLPPFRYPIPLASAGGEEVWRIIFLGKNSSVGRRTAIVLRPVGRLVSLARRLMYYCSLGG